jgi:hypothetical protein
MIQIRMKGRLPIGAKAMEVGNFIMGATTAIQAMNIFEVVCLVGCNTDSWVSTEGMSLFLKELGVGKIKSTKSHLEMAIKMIDNPHLDIYWAKGAKQSIMDAMSPRQFVLNEIDTRSRLHRPAEPHKRKLHQGELFDKQTCEDIDTMKIVCSDLAHAVAELCDITKKSPWLTNPDRAQIGNIELSIARMIKEIT